MTCKTVFVLLLGMHFGFLFMNIPPSFETMMSIYRISYTRMGVLVSAFLWTHTILQIPGGMIIDRMGTRSSIFIGLISMLIGSTLPLASTDFSLGVLGRVFVGIGTGMSFIAAIRLITLFASPKKTGFYQAQFGAAVSLGSLLAYVFIPFLVKWGWRWIYIPSGGLCIFLIVILLMLKVEDPPAAQKPQQQFGKILRNPTGWVIGAYHALSYGSFITLGNWIPSLISERMGRTAAELAWGGVVVMSISMMGRVTGGLLLKRVSPQLVANGSMLLLFFLYLCLLSPVLGVVLAGAFLMAWVGSMNFGAFWQLAGRATSGDSVATLFGFVNFLANLGAVFFTLTFGWVKDHTGTFSMGFGIMAFITAISLMLGRRVVGEINAGCERTGCQIRQDRQDPA